MLGKQGFRDVCFRVEWLDMLRLGEKVSGEKLGKIFFSGKHYLRYCLEI